MHNHFKTNIGSTSSAHFLAISFLSVIAIGTFALLLPFATYNDIKFIDALFTAVSAVCVTGLVTVDVSTTFTIFGKCIIMVLIQIGGLGIMTFAACAIWMLREKISINDRMMLEYSFIQGESALTLKKFIFFIVKYTFTIEGIGAIFYFLSFKDINNIGERFFYSVFHSVSAFCNAGFSLFSDNLMRYTNSASINLITCSLIILGGLGFIVVFELRNKFVYIISRKEKKQKYKTRTLTVHTWLVIHVTVFLIIAGTVSIYLLQRYSAHFETLSLLQAFFQSVTCRTAMYELLMSLFYIFVFFLFWK